MWGLSCSIARTRSAEYSPTPKVRYVNRPVDRSLARTRFPCAMHSPLANSPASGSANGFRRRHSTSLRPPVAHVTCTGRRRGTETPFQLVGTVAGRRPCLRRTRLPHAHALNQVRVGRRPDCRQPGRLRALRAIDRPTGYSPRTRARSQHRDRRAHWSVGRERRLGLPGRIGRVVPLTNLASTAPRLRHSLPTDLSVGAARSTARSAPPHLHFPPKHLANPLEPTCRR